MRAVRRPALVFGLLAILGVASTAPQPRAPAPKRTSTDPGVTFSVAFPTAWRDEGLLDGEWSQLALFAERPHDVSIVIASRPLEPPELEMGQAELLDRLIEQTMINVTALGNDILQVGHVDPLVEEWPAFAAVATSRDQSKMMTIMRSPIQGRLYVVTTLTDNLQGSPELGAEVSEVVRSLEILEP